MDAKKRVVDCWNRLHQGTIDSSSINSFKNGLERTRATQMGVFVDNRSAWPWPRMFWRSVYRAGTPESGMSPGVLPGMKSDSWNANFKNSDIHRLFIYKLSYSLSWATKQANSKKNNIV